ncbi:Nuclear receptor 2C2-associated protein [Taenia crassiceps]|uniref:Nuclear receptor 2C2-associated protein n=1 Tax=Taenia crassiceps TaxID=6207 RepID=A0ABR4QCL6_9CEST
MVFRVRSCILWRHLASGQARQNDASRLHLPFSTFLFDGNPETCWQSNSGESQWILVEFKEPLKITSIRIQFQGGFAVEEALLRLWTKEKKDCPVSYPFHPTNTNSLQSFSFTDANAYTCAAIILKKATDPFGRIVVYQLDFSFA